jgi:V8-like Glu-specific endopeptidase
MVRPVLAAAAGAGVLVMIVAPPAAAGAARLAIRLAAAVHTLDRETHPGASGLPRDGTAPVGALFTTTSAGQALGTHFCTASVVDSPAGDLVMTAAHCVSGQVPGQFVFVPGYRNGRAPFGVWTVTRVIVDKDWSSSASPDDDVAFLIVSKPGTTSVQARTGGERLSSGQPPGQLVQVIGYPDGASAPISCVNRAELFSTTQFDFDCEGYTDGTSGSALLADVSPASGLGTVIGVIGGYEQGGDVASVSYAARLGENVRALYAVATAQQ